MPKAKPYTGPVDEQLATQLLNSTGQHMTVDGEEMLLGHALFRAARKLTEVVNRSNDLLEGSPFAKIVAEHLATKMNRRGHAAIAVAPTGEVELYISYDDQPARRPAPRKAKLPLLEELKARAEKMGVDISEFGIKRKKILEHLDAVERGDVKPKKAKGRRKKAQVQTAQDPPEDDPGPMSAGPDETKVSPPPDDPKPPKRRGFVKTSDAVEGPVVVGAGSTAAEPTPAKAAKPAKSQGARGSSPNMRELVQESKELSISDLLESEPPKQ